MFTYITERHNVQFGGTVDITGRNSLSFITKREVVSTQAYCVKCRAKREMRDAKYGLEAICGGGGMGICAIVERK